MRADGSNLRRLTCSQGAAAGFRCAFYDDGVGSEDSIFRASIEAFAAIGVPTTFFSCLMGFLRTVRGESADRIDEGINFGLSYGFVPGAILATGVFIWELWA